MQRKIGLTGGIATGKTTVTDYLCDRAQLPILDADVYAREAVAVGSPVLGAIAARYGAEILQPDGSLKRTRLGEIVFADATERAWLESQTHPFVRDRFRQTLDQLQTEPIVILAIPLLFEAQLEALVTEIWVVTCTPAQQLARLMQRNALTRSQAESRIAAQWPLTQKCERADVVLDNSGTLPELYDQIDRALAT